MEKQIAIELRNITKTFGKTVANKNVNLKVYKNEVLAILGENGSGKTTLMNIISGIYAPDEGEIFINGEKVYINIGEDDNDPIFTITDLLPHINVLFSYLFLFPVPS